jgi:hypothetical protein
MLALTILSQLIVEDDRATSQVQAFASTLRETG